MQKLRLEFYEPEDKTMVASFESESFNLSYSRTTYGTPNGKVFTLYTTHHFDMLIEKTTKEGQIHPSLLMKHYVDDVSDHRIEYLKIVDAEVQKGICGTRILVDIRTESEILLKGFEPCTTLSTP